VTFVSHSQNHEDVVLFRALKNIENGFYIDVGAAWPDFHSVTKSFYDKGWMGINLEPNKNLFGKLSISRPRDINLNVAAGDGIDEGLLYTIEETGLSTLSEEISNLHKANGWVLNPNSISIMTLDQICYKFLPKKQEIHFLKIDVEGFEKEVIRGNNWKKYRPWVVVVESKHPTRSEETFQDWEPVLFENNYLFGFFDGLNRFYVAEEKRELLDQISLPANVLDDFMDAEVQALQGHNRSLHEEVNSMLSRLSAQEVKLEEAEKAVEDKERISENLEVKLEQAETTFQNLQRDYKELERDYNLGQARLTEEQELVQLNREAKRIVEIELETLKKSALFRRTLKMRALYFRLRINWKNKISSPSIIKLQRFNVKTLVSFIARRSAEIIKRSAISRSFARKLLAASPRLQQLIYRALTHSRKTKALEFSSLRSNSVELDSNLVLSKILIPESEKLIFLYVEHTSGFNRITGVQRVVYKLAVNLLAHQVKLVLVKLSENLELKPLSRDELTNFAKYASCPELLEDVRLYDESNFIWILKSLKNKRLKSWLVVPEVTYHTTHTKQPTNRLIKLCRDLGLKVGFIFYDSIPFISEDAKPSAAEHARYLSTLALADMVWPISKYSQTHIEDYFQNEENLNRCEFPQLKTIELAADMETLRKISSVSHSKKIILSVGTIDARKNQLNLVEAFNKYCEKYPNTDWQLYVVGLIREDYKEIFEKVTRKNNNIKTFYNASDDEIAEYYEQCDFTVFPSTEEGYGLPILESLWNYKPCLCASFGAMGEIAEHGGCVTVDTTDLNLLFEGLERLINEPNLRELKKSEILTRSFNTWFEYTGRLLASTDDFTFNSSKGGRIYYWVDATVEAPSNTGIQRVCRILARELMNSGAELVPIKWNSELQEIQIASPSELLYLGNWNGPRPDKWSKVKDLNDLHEDDRYLMVDLPLNRDLEIQRNILEYFKKKKVQTSAIFYDAIPHKLSNMYPENFTKAHREYMDILDSVDKIFAISSHSRKDLIDYINISKNRGLNIEERIISIELPTQFPGTPARIEVEIGKSEEVCTILAVGTVEPRKNHETLIEAFLLAERASKRPLKLVILGSDSSFDRNLPKRIEALIEKSRNITWIKDASDAVLEKCYQDASFTIYPSYEEGFGLPIAESLWFGLPCICADFGQMKEIASKGGCLPTNVLSKESLSESILLLANDLEKLKTLQLEIKSRYFRTWLEYAQDIIGALSPKIGQKTTCQSESINNLVVNYPKRPQLSIVISTFNRSKWLEINLENMKKLISALTDKVEIIVCDNHSTDQTHEILRRYQSNSNIKPYRNSWNVGMLGNLSESVALANGEYIWLIGDDDIIRESSIEKILNVIDTNRPELIYLNYAYSTRQEPPRLEELFAYHEGSTQMTLNSSDRLAPLREITDVNENFFTAIYTFVAKKKHAQKIFNQDTSGSEFSSLQSCVPTSKYILNNLLDFESYWISEPAITINMNVSWGAFTPLWILERVPEVYDLAEFNGVEKEKVDFWRSHTMKMFVDVFREVFSSDNLSITRNVDLKSISRRVRHLKEFDQISLEMIKIYESARKANHPLAVLESEEFATYFHAQ
jgi:FkbM family methyltransferase